MDRLTPQAIRQLKTALANRPALPTGTPVKGPQASTYSDGTTFGNATTGFRTHSSATLSELRDARPTERRDAVKNSRFLAAKIGFVKALYQNTVLYAIGRGMMPSSGCTDLEWADMANDRFLAWASRKSFDIREGNHFFAMQKIVAADVMRDGDVGAAPVRDLDGEPRVQHFPSDLIGDVAGESVFIPSGSRARWREGILRSAVGTPIAYRVMRDPTQLLGLTDSRAYWDYPAKNFWHVAKDHTLNANRPLPWIHHGDQSALNILDLNTLEMQAAKLNSFFAAAIKVANADQSDMLAAMRELMTSETETVNTGADADGVATSKSIERSYLNLMGGAAIPVLGPGEELQFFKNERPSTTFSGFIEYLLADIAVGFGIPIQFAWGLTGLAGPHARLVLQQADWFFQEVADMVVSNYCQPIWESFIADQMNRGLLRAPAAGSNWRSVQWQGPGSMTIDKGRDGKLYLEMVANGMGRRSAWHEMTGKHGKTELQKTVAEIRYIMQLCEEAGVPVEYVLGEKTKGAAQIDPEELAEQMAEAAGE